MKGIFDPRKGLGKIMENGARSLNRDLNKLGKERRKVSLCNELILQMPNQRSHVLKSPSNEISNLNF